MSFGSILVGLAAAVLVATYIARPFRQSHTNFDNMIDTWVAEVEKPTPVPRRASSSPPPVSTSPPPNQAQSATEEVINFCPQCGQKVQPEHRFCPGCGTRLRT